MKILNVVFLMLALLFQGCASTNKGAPSHRNTGEWGGSRNANYDAWSGAMGGPGSINTGGGMGSGTGSSGL